MSLWFWSPELRLRPVRDLDFRCPGMGRGVGSGPLCHEVAFWRLMGHHYTVFSLEVSGVAGSGGHSRATSLRGLSLPRGGLRRHGFGAGSSLRPHLVWRRNSHSQGLMELSPGDQSGRGSSAKCTNAQPRLPCCALSLTFCGVLSGVLPGHSSKAGGQRAQGWQLPAEAGSEDLQILTAGDNQL